MWSVACWPNNNRPPEPHIENGWAQCCIKYNTVIQYEIVYSTTAMSIWYDAINASDTRTPIHKCSRKLQRWRWRRHNDTGELRIGRSVFIIKCKYLLLTIMCLYAVRFCATNSFSFIQHLPLSTYFGLEGGRDGDRKRKTVSIYATKWRMLITSVAGAKCWNAEESEILANG